ncbi:glycoside hydrolase family 19 protein [Pseudomonas umsongensis]|uniref:Glycoside hydrolase family 19 protein n=1 Tax=Pseudomonas umsongensis TaxID=198618 RepID=A0AAE6ZTI4_9PSED|nr:glycoside hydrolase family 19 protein [Pseudomonas umsongensis]QJC78907.1 glycoside hydrolase family 19 protein [Pseudomonas umsongensis]
MPITKQQLLQILPNAGKQAGVFASALNLAMDRFQINTRMRVAAFIAQVGHESGQFRYVRELGGDQYLSKYDTGPLAKRLGNTPEADGDGQTYRGRGLIQITGHDNYLACSKALFSDDRLLRTPELLEQAEWAAKSAAWFWHSRNLNALADAGDFVGVTRRINGGTNGMVERHSFYSTALKVLA